MTRRIVVDTTLEALEESLHTTLRTRLLVEDRRQHGDPIEGVPPTLVLDDDLIASIARELARNTAQSIMCLECEPDARCPRHEKNY